MASNPSAARWARLPRALALLGLGILAAGVAGCSLISLKSPEKPLSTRDLNARILTHEYSARFITGVARTADQIAAASDAPDVRLNACLLYTSRRLCCSTAT